MAGSVTFGFYHPVLSRHLEFLGFHAYILYTLLYLKQHALEKKLGRSQHLKCSNLMEENTSLILLSRELRTEWNYKNTENFPPLQCLFPASIYRLQY